MKNALTVFLVLLAGAAFGQSSPGWVQGYVPSAAQWNAAFSSKQNYPAKAPRIIVGGGFPGYEYETGGGVGYVGQGDVSATLDNGTSLSIVKGGVLTSLYVNSSAAPGSAKSLVATLYVGSTASAVTCTITGTSATQCSDTAHAASVLAGQIVILKVASTSGAANWNVTWGAVLQ